MSDTHTALNSFKSAFEKLVCIIHIFIYGVTETPPCPRLGAQMPQVDMVLLLRSSGGKINK
jgi:hypothetical protein